MLKFDFSLAFQETLETGLSFSELTASSADAVSALEDVLESDPAFLRILNETSTIDQVEQHRSWLSGFDDFVVVGIGGSALGNAAIHSALKPLNWNSPTYDRKGLCRVFILDNVDPDFVNSLLEEINPGKSVFNVISKSGTTAESMANYLVLRDYLRKNGLETKKHFIFTTDPEEGTLRQISEEEGIRRLSIPQGLGGRFSVLSTVGMLSGLSEGIDIQKLYEGARNGLERYTRSDFKSNPMLINTLLHYLYLRKKHDISVMMPYSNRLYLLADWYRQLWAESLGKKFDINGKTVNVGQTPIKALGAVDQHSQIQLYNEGPKDKIVTFLKVLSFSEDFKIPLIHSDICSVSYLGGKLLSELLNSELEGTALALCENGVPNLTISFPIIDELHVGEFIVFYELMTATMGSLMKVNPYDQPGVELGKKITYALMGRNGYDDIRQRYQERASWRFEI